jgi:hypothetical protein
MAVFKNSLEKSILATIAYFDIFDYPLTLVEIWKWLWEISDFRFQISDFDSQSSVGNRKSEIENREIGLVEVQKVLDSSEVLKSLVESRRGFYFLKGRGEAVELRQQRYNLAEKKFKKVLKVIRFLKFVPGIKMIAVCNDLAWSNAPEGSDIDLFVVTEKNKIWTARLWAASFLQLFGLRPGKIIKDKICLSFFVDENHLNLENLSIKPSSPSLFSLPSLSSSSLSPDIYLIYWISQIAPIYDVGGVYQKFLDANTWIKKYLPNIFASEIGERRRVASGRLILTKRSGLGERFFRWLQLKVMPKKLKEMANRDTQVIINDSMLKFHENDRREEFRRKWEEKLLILNDY